MNTGLVCPPYVTPKSKELKDLIKVTEGPYSSHIAIWPQVNDFPLGCLTLLLFLPISPAKYPLNDL